MKYAIIAGALLLGCVAAIPARAAGRLAAVTLIDRDTGQQLEAYYRHGEYWVAGEPGAHYAIYIQNHLGERLLAVTSVDGVNVLTGQTAGWDQGGYVFDAWESYQVTGWRKSDYQVAAFAFTTAPRSYAARTGRPDNVGVIGIALFREQPSSAALPPQPPQIAGGGYPSAQRSPPAAERAQGEPAARVPGPIYVPAPAAAPAPAPAQTGSAGLSEDAIANAPMARAPQLGTAHGEREYSYVAHTSFVRWHSRPDEIIRIRYDSLDNLIALGIVRPHRYPGQRPSPFPSTDHSGYVPDPPPYDAAWPR